jgi:hypothetical protein
MAESEDATRRNLWRSKVILVGEPEDQRGSVGTAPKERLEADSALGVVSAALQGHYSE